MKMRLFLLSVVVLIMTSGCSMMRNTKNQYFVGTWSGVLVDDSVIVLTMTDDMRMKGKISGATNVEFTCKYAIDLSADPITLDEYDFENADDPDERYVGIIRIIDENSFLTMGNMSWQNDRPTSFDDSGYPYVMTRKTE